MKTQAVAHGYKTVQKFSVTPFQIVWAETWCRHLLVGELAMCSECRSICFT